MKNVVLLLLFQFSILGWSQSGSVFPEVKGHLLNGNSLNVPINNNKYTVLAIAFNREAEDMLKQWLNPLYNAFIKKEKGSAQFDMAEIFDVNFVFIPMISGFKKIEEEFKENTDKEFWPYIMDTEKTDIKSIQKLLEIGNSKIPYFFVLDKFGKVLEVESGKFSVEKLDKLEDAIE